jgi:NADPH:quinone reductase-like Zn-dependent oxidoreductase
MEIVATGFGNPSVLKIVPTDDVAPNRGEVAIDVRAAGVNHVDYTRYADHPCPGPDKPSNKWQATGARQRRDQAASSWA